MSHAHRYFPPSRQQAGVGPDRRAAVLRGARADRGFPESATCAASASAQARHLWRRWHTVAAEKRWSTACAQRQPRTLPPARTPARNKLEPRHAVVWTGSAGVVAGRRGVRPGSWELRACDSGAVADPELAGGTGSHSVPALFSLRQQQPHAHLLQRLRESGDLRSSRLPAPDPDRPAGPPASRPPAGPSRRAWRPPTPA